MRPELASGKSELRRWARSQPPVVPAESEAVAAALTAWLESLPRSAVLVYLSLPHEVPVHVLATELESRHRFLITRTPPEGSLTIHELTGPRERHPFGYEQPVAGSPVVEPAEVDIVLVPGLCFDSSGGRLGWGKGYYDRLLGEIPAPVVKVGVTIQRLVVPRVPIEAHDVRMTLLATERGVGPVDAASPPVP